ncbi:hypothetical protein GCM10022286_16360 [Gryllotalpicola daejeonensis]|uniref:Uncharacterized protein n=1 Tax=Gryllotalpicola daejeonensis TaxID=993087 RepID=A0ABP7ZJN0_9MICO
MDDNGITITPGDTAGSFTICATDADTSNTFYATDSDGVKKGDCPTS